MADFKEKWMENLKSRAAFARGRELDGPAEFEESIWALASSVAKGVKDQSIHIPEEGGDEVAIRDILRLALANDSGLKRAKLSYSKVCSLASELTNERIVESRADLAEKFRFLFFRIVLAISLAAVVVATYAVADYLGVPMPMIRVPVA
jgi:hypothetical protein